MEAIKLLNYPPIKKGSLKEEETAENTVCESGKESDLWAEGRGRRQRVGVDGGVPIEGGSLDLQR